MSSPSFRMKYIMEQVGNYSLLMEKACSSILQDRIRNDIEFPALPPHASVDETASFKNPTVEELKS